MWRTAFIGMKKSAIDCFTVWNRIAVLHPHRTRHDEHSFVIMLGVQTFLLLDEDECRTGAESNHENDQSYKESYETVAQDETDDG